MNRPEYQSVGKSVRKKDAMQQLLGKPLYTEDIVRDALVVKLLRSPHANAIVETIDTSKAKKVAGVVDVFTWEDVPNERFSNAGQTSPETSPYDRLIIDRHVRFVGDVVAIVAAENEAAANKALERIKVTYDVLEPVLDFRTAKDNPVLVHPEDNWRMLCDLGGDNTRNLVGTTADEGGDIEAVVRNGRTADGTGLMINSSRAILYAYSGEGFAEAAADDRRRRATAPAGTAAASADKAEAEPERPLQIAAE